jgi:hypothetical protein
MVARRSERKKREIKRKGCIPQLRSSCGRGRCASRPQFVKGYTIVSGKYAPTDRGQYCRKPKSRPS